MSPAADEPVGSLAEEAAKLLRVVTADRAAKAETDSYRRDAAAGQATHRTCDYGCPVCRLRAMADDPEVAQQVAGVRESVTELARVFLEGFLRNEPSPGTDASGQPGATADTTEPGKDQPWD